VPGDGRSLIVKLVGGAAVLEASSSFDIGRRNLLAIKKMLWARRLGAVAEDVGGNISRTVEVTVAEGRVHIYSPGRGKLGKNLKMESAMAKVLIVDDDSRSARILAGWWRAWATRCS